MKKIIEDTIQTIRYNYEEADLLVSDIKVTLLPTDKIRFYNDTGYHSENNSWNPYTEFYIIREREETDEEYEARIEKENHIKSEINRRMYEEYLQLKEKFES